MGCWSESCALSGLEIAYNDPVYACILPSAKTTFNSSSYNFDFPIFKGKYDDYGGVIVTDRHEMELVKIMNSIIREERESTNIQFDEESSLPEFDLPEITVRVDRYMGCADQYQMAFIHGHVMDSILPNLHLQDYYGFHMDDDPNEPNPVVENYSYQGAKVGDVVKARLDHFRRMNLITSRQINGLHIQKGVDLAITVTQRMSLFRNHIPHSRTKNSSTLFHYLFMYLFMTGALPSFNPPSEFMLDCADIILMRILTLSLSQYELRKNVEPVLNASQHGGDAILREFCQGIIDFIDSDSRKNG